MKIKIIFFLLVALTILGTHSSIAQSYDLCNKEEYNCVDGEKLTYKLYYKLSFMWIPTGEVEFTSKEYDDYYEVRVVGKTYRAYDPIFKVRDYFYSKIDKSTLKPLTFIRKVHEGDYKRYFHTEFDYESNIATTINGKDKTSTKKTEVNIDDYCVQDVISVLYQLRALQLNQYDKGDQFKLDIFLDNKIYDVNLFYNGDQKKKHIRNLGSYKTHMMIPETIAGEIFDVEDKMKVWVSADENKIPLLIESPISVGTVKAVLKSHSGLKTDLKKWNE